MRQLLVCNGLTRDLSSPCAAYLNLLVIKIYGCIRTNEILNESNEIAGLQKRLELSGREVLLLQNELDNKIRNMSDRTLEMGQVRA